MLCTSVCKYDDFNTDWYRRWAVVLQQEISGFDAFRPDRVLHRKNWEYAAIAQALDERGMLEPGRQGCGFAVGLEPLPSLFAAHGARILATDLPTDADHSQNLTASASAWAATGQHAASLDALYVPALLDRATFLERVRYKPVDMRNLQLPWEETFDFIWSSCSLEHLGSLGEGLGFVKDSLGLLKPGGIAVHTTEYNVSSNDETITTGSFVIYRKRDIEALGFELRKMRSAMSRCDFYAGEHLFDIEYDKTPFTAADPLKHIKLDIAGHVATSMIMIIRKGAP